MLMMMLMLIMMCRRVAGGEGKVQGNQRGARRNLHRTRRILEDAIVAIIFFFLIRFFPSSSQHFRQSLPRLYGNSASSAADLQLSWWSTLSAGLVQFCNSLHGEGGTLHVFIGNLSIGFQQSLD